MEASATALCWFHAGFELRDPPRRPSGSGPHAIRLWLGATDRSGAARMAAEVEVRRAGQARRAQLIGQRRPLTPVVPSGRDQMPPELADIARRPWAVLEGCLVQDVEDADAVAAEWLELSGGAPSVAEESMNRIHLWDLLDDEEPAHERDELAAAIAVAHAWRTALAAVPGADQVVVELDVSAEGPQLTAYRLPGLGADGPATVRRAGSRMHGE